MRNKILTISIIVSISLGFANPAYCGDSIRKLTRGVCNLATFPLELLNNYGDKPENKIDTIKGYTLNLFDRIMRMGQRALVGAYETATFLIPVPKALFLE